MRRLKDFLFGRGAFAMPYYAIVLAAVAVPLMILSIDVTRYFYLRTHLQSATDAACEAAAQALDLPYFKSTGQARIDLSLAGGYAHREFGSTTSEQGITKYAPALTNIHLLSATSVGCSASAQMVPTFYVGVITARVSSASDMRVSRH